MLRVDMLPAAHGDCLWVEYGDPDGPFRILVDAGPPFTTTYEVLVDRIRALPPAHRVFELFVVTHIDADHIGGAIRLLRDAETLGLTFKRIWYNGHDQLRAVPGVPHVLGVAQGEYLSLLIEQYEQRTGTTVLNVDAPGDWVGVDDGQDPPTIVFPDELSLTVLGPTPEQLISLAMEWDEVVEELGFRDAGLALLTIEQQLEASRQLRPLLATRDTTQVLGDDSSDEPPEVPAEFGRQVLGGEGALGSDASVANGSSIAMLLEYQGESVLLGGDSFASVLAGSVQSVLAARSKSRLPVGAFKLPHHGSAANLSGDLLDLLSTKHYLISTSGAQFGHPHASAIQALLDHHDGRRGKPELWFNHDSVTTAPWKSKDDQRDLGIVSHYPKGGVSWQ